MSSHSPKVLVVEDDGAVSNLVSTALTAHGYEVVTAVSGGDALRKMSESSPEVVLLDLGLPDIDGVEVIRRVRSWTSTPIIVVSARGDERDKICALDTGADDYLTKPFSVGELLARIRTALRHVGNQDLGQHVNAASFANGDLRIDYSAGVVTLAGQDLHLTPIEYRLLCLLSRNVGRVLTHQYILNEVWGHQSDGDLASLRVFMGTLRKKIEDEPSRPRYIQTHVGVGYRMIAIS